MKKVLIFYILLSLSFSSCKVQKAGTVQPVAKQETHFKLVEGSRQRIYPGQQTAESKYKEHWVLILEGPANQFAQLKLIVSGCEITLPDLSERGVVLGTDTKNYTIEFDIPDTQINTCLISSSEEAELVIDQGFRSEVILLKDLNNKEDVFLPSSMD
jgi:hypothetical protein